MRRLLITTLLVGMALPAGAASFQSLVDKVESELGTRRVRMPGVGALVNSFMFVRRPGGTSSLNFATFEGGLPRFQAVVRQAVGRNWQPMISVHSNRKMEDVMIYVHADGGKFEMLIATNDSDDATLVQLKLDGARVLDWLRDPAGMNGSISGSIQ